MRRLIIACRLLALEGCSAFSPVLAHQPSSQRGSETTSFRRLLGLTFCVPCCNLSLPRVSCNLVWHLQIAWLDFGTGILQDYSALSRQRIRQVSGTWENVGHQIVQQANVKLWSPLKCFANAVKCSKWCNLNQELCYKKSCATVPIINYIMAKCNYRSELQNIL